MRRFAIVAAAAAGFAAGLALVPAFLGAQPAGFGYPVGGEPWYYVKAGFTPAPGMAGAAWTVARVEAGGVRCRDFVLFQDGRETSARVVDGSRPFEVKARFGWSGGKAYTIRLALKDDKTGKETSLSRELKAPAGPGYWDSAWKNWVSLVLDEEDGVARTSYPVHATLAILAGYFHSPDEIRVVRADATPKGVSYRVVPSQVYDVSTWNDPKIMGIKETDAKTGAPIVRYHPTTTFSVAFLADLKARERAAYLVFFNNPAAKAPRVKTDLAVARGKAMARTIDNGFYKVVLQETSGAITEITEKKTGIKLEHKLETNGAIQWNPDIFSPPHVWYHSSDWTAPKAAEVTGPVFYSLTMEGDLPQPPGVHVGIRYRFYAGSPFIDVETTTHIRDDIFVMALRNAEVVFNKAVFTKALFRRDGKVETLDFATSRMHPDHAAVLRPDTPWVGLFDPGKGIGFGCLYLDMTNPSLGGGEATTMQPFIYIQHGPWYYVSRGFVYSFGTNNQTRMMPVKAGSVYYDRNVWTAFPAPGGAGIAERLDTAYAMLRHPVAVFEDMETFAETPEGWVVPILTEPFEEGVKGSVGGKERRK